MAATTASQRPLAAATGRGSTGGESESRDATRAFAGRSRRVKVPELALGLLLTVGFALGAVLWQLRSTDRVPALVIRASVERGDTVVQSDLRTAFVGRSDDVVRVAPSEVGSIVGQVALVDLGPGTMVSPDLVSDERHLEKGTGIAGLALEAGQYPLVGLSAGDRVNVLVGVADGAPGDDPSIIVQRAEVYEVEDLDDGRLLISLQTSETGANRIAAVSGQDRFRLVQVPQ